MHIYGVRLSNRRKLIELHHRAWYFIQHIMSSDVKSQDITTDMVHVDVLQQRFHVRSLVTDKRHSVNIRDKNTVPTCDCQHYIKTRLPCKHFSALFRHTADVSFASLPSHCRDHPLFVVDDNRSIVLVDMCDKQIYI